MSVVLSIVLVLGLFTALGLVAWAAVSRVQANVQSAVPRPSGLPTSLPASRQLAGQHVG
jgi:hypothetical protein